LSDKNLKCCDLFQAVLRHAGSPAASLMVWAGTGIVSFLGALCYSELALLMPESGSDYTYIKRGVFKMQFAVFDTSMIILLFLNITKV
jgi:amino acid transporter